MSDGRAVAYLYDGSFEGLLTCIFESVYRREMPADISADMNVQQSLVWDSVYIAADEEKAMRVYSSIEKKISHSALVCFYYTYLSDLEGRELTLLKYLLAGYRLGKSLNSHLTVDCVRTVNQTRLRVSNEAHSMKQFLRFSELENGVYYAPIAPKCRVLELVAPHFRRRFPAMPWVIHDTAHGECMVYNGKSCELYDAVTMPKLEFSEEEKQYRKLWKTFYDTVEIQPRHNEKCRQTHMPKRYWRYMPELWEV